MLITALAVGCRDGAPVKNANIQHNSSIVIGEQVVSISIENNKNFFKLGQLPVFCSHGHMLVVLDDDNMIFSCNFGKLFRFSSVADGILQATAITEADVLDRVYNAKERTIDAQMILREFERLCGTFHDFDENNQNIIYNGLKGECFYDKINHRASRFRAYFWSITFLRDNSSIFHDFDDNLNFNNQIIGKISTHELGNGSYTPAFISNGNDVDKKYYIVVLVSGENDEQGNPFPYTSAVVQHNVKMVTKIMSPGDSYPMACSHTFNRLFYVNDLRQIMGDNIVFNNCLNEIGDADFSSVLDYCNDNELIIYNPEHCDVKHTIRIPDMNLIGFKLSGNDIYLHAGEGVFKIVLE